MAFREATGCVFAVVLFAVGLPAGSQTVTQQVPAIDGLVTSYVSGHHVPGLSEAVVDRGRVILTQGYGIADVENSVPATADTVYRIASISISKSITIQIHHCDGCDEAGRSRKTGPRCSYP